MAVLTAEDYKILRSIFYRTGGGKEELKALPTFPSKTQLIAAVQAIEDAWSDSTFQAEVKSAFDTALGQTSTNALAKKMANAWMRWKGGT